MRLNSHKDRIWKGAIYGRVSTEKDNQKTSNENQISLLEDWIKQQGNIELVNTYLDESSGTKIKNRHGFLRMLKDAKDGKIDFIVVKSVTRFARNQVDSIKLAKELSESDVRIYFHQEQIDTFNNIQMLGLWAWLAETESRNTSERRSVGGREAQKKGRFTTNRPPLGYKTIDKRLVVDEKEAMIIRELFNLYLEGKGHAKIAYILNEKGYRTRRGHMFRADKVKYIIQNEVYKGVFIGNRYTKVDMLSDKLIERPREEWIVIENNHEAIIESRIFDKVQKLVKDKSFTLGKRTVSLFAGVVRCGKCGRSMNRTTVKRKLKDGTRKEYSSYYCVGKATSGKTYCDAKNISEAIFVDIINNELKYLKINPSVIENLKNEVVGKINDKLSRMNEDESKVEEEIGNISNKRKKLTEKFISGVIEDDMYMEMDSKLKSELKRLEELRTKNKVLDVSKEFNKNYLMFTDILDRFKDVRKLTNIEVRRLVESIIVEGDNITVNLKISQSNFDFNMEDSIEEMVTTKDEDIRDLLYVPLKSFNNSPIVSTIGIKLKHSIDVYMKVI